MKKLLLGLVLLGGMGVASAAHFIDGHYELPNNHRFHHSPLNRSLGVVQYEAPKYSSVLTPDIQVFLGMGTQGTPAQLALFNECQRSKPGQCMATVVGPNGKMSINNITCYRDCMRYAKNNQAALARMERKLAIEYRQSIQALARQAQKELKGGVDNPVYRACSKNCGQKPSGFCLHNCILKAQAAAVHKK